MQPQFNGLPIEIIYRILCFLSPLDVVRLRVISKQLRDITHDLSLWRTLYANAQLPRPPGPFPSQSAHFLERTLIRSARSVRSWTTEPVYAIRSQQLEIKSFPLMGAPIVVGGRWLISCEYLRRILLYDIDPEIPYLLRDQEASVRVLWETEQGNITLWDACSITSSSGDVIIYVAFRPRTPNMPWKLLEFRLDCDADQVYEYISLDIPPTRALGFVNLLCRQAPFIYMRGVNLIFDTRTRMFYEFPEFSSGLGLAPASLSSGPASVLLTETHIVALFHCGTATLVQVFTIPTDPKSNNTAPGSVPVPSILQLTHEGKFEHLDKFSKLVVIKRSTVNPITGTTTLRFLQSRQGDYEPFSPPELRCLDLVLPKNSPGCDIVLPMSIRTRDLFSVAHASHDPALHESNTYLDHSPEGHVIGVHVCYNRELRTSTSADISTSEFYVVKFTIDASADECDDVWGTVSAPAGTDNDGELFRSTRMWFDGIRGRVYHGGENTVPRRQAVVRIVDVR